MSTSEVQMNAALEILDWLNFDTSLDVVQSDAKQVARIIAKHLQPVPEISVERRNQIYDQAIASGRCFDDEYNRLLELGRP